MNTIPCHIDPTFIMSRLKVNQTRRSSVSATRYNTPTERYVCVECYIVEWNIYLQDLWMETPWLWVGLMSAAVWADSFVFIRKVAPRHWISTWTSHDTYMNLLIYSWILAIGSCAPRHQGLTIQHSAPLGLFRRLYNTEYNNRVMI